MDSSPANPSTGSLPTHPVAGAHPPYMALPAPPELTYMSSQDAISAMVDFAKTHGYGMSLKRSKPDGKDAIKTRYYYHCDRHGNYSPKGTIRERTSRSTGCMFQILIQKAADSTCWHLKIKNAQHNHGPMIQPDRSQTTTRVRERKSLGAQSQRKTWKIALIPGDGIGIEVTEAAKLVLQKLAQVSKKFDFHFEKFDWGTQQYHTLGYYMPTDAIDRLKKFDAILFGAVGSPEVPDHISLWGLMLPLRTELKQYVNVRPVRILRGIQSPLRNVPSEWINWVIIRENSEGEYAGHGGISHADQSFGVATDVSIFTRPAIERIFRFAFETAKSRPRKKLTMITKSNAQKWGMVYWDSIFLEIKREYPDIETDTILVDSMTARMISEPHAFDTIVATNLHADILSDLAAALSGSLGMAPSSNLDPTRQNPSMFEPIHGSAPDIAGKGIANPVGALWSAAEMVKWLGEVEAGEFLLSCVENITQWGVRTRDLGGHNSCMDVTNAVVQELERLSR